MTVGTIGGLSGSGRAELGKVFARGRRVTTTADAAAALGTDDAAAAKRLAAWASRGWVRRVRRGLYLAVPVDAPDPASWTADPWYLADLVWSPCYVTGWSAANHWGLTDQIFRSTVIATTQRVRQVSQTLGGHAYLVHHVASQLLGWGTSVEWRDERRIQVADPARTVMELLGDPSLGGGIRHVADILDVYLASQDPGGLLATGDRLGNGTAFKRLGYLVEVLGIDNGDLLKQARTRVTTGYSLLDPAQKHAGVRIRPWNLVANVELRGVE
jgi:predicted transcriptional regulator of viral defense system